MALTTFITPRFVLAVVAGVALTTSAFGQTTRPKNDTGETMAIPHPSAFEGYRAFSDEPVPSWKAANDTAARIGGWREYAKQAQRREGTPSRPVEPDAKPGLKTAP